MTWYFIFCIWYQSRWTVWLQLTEELTGINWNLINSRAPLSMQLRSRVPFPSFFFLFSSETWENEFKLTLSNKRSELDHSCIQSFNYSLTFHAQLRKFRERGRRGIRSCPSAVIKVSAVTPRGFVARERRRCRAEYGTMRPLVKYSANPNGQRSYDDEFSCLSRAITTL